MKNIILTIIAVTFLFAFKKDDVKSIPGDEVGAIITFSKHYQNIYFYKCDTYSNYLKLVKTRKNDTITWESVDDIKQNISTGPLSVATAIVYQNALQCHLVDYNESGALLSYGKEGYHFMKCVSFEKYVSMGRAGTLSDTFTWWSSNSIKTAVVRGANDNGLQQALKCATGK